MNDWSYIDADPAEHLARLHFFSMTKHQPDGDVEFRITVREHASPQKLGMHFYAEADKHYRRALPIYDAALEPDSLRATTTMATPEAASMV